ncbi:putative membrane protein YeiB [Microbacterium resistens]|uniref:Membrane protein YeiB n=1 Tax=Microbacterium resistens TaxID=156977 RepID=A0ABU1SDD3_9MICO|nr:heparan-alpha-glucosaminide N-acetyltransferase domain-containing protein [Microbacterium resistens]MDR6867258.1 putative membrane protein YeiB [Microbacterium resistens]
MSATTTRLVIPDVLRGIAIIAMLIAHAFPLLPGAPRALLYATGVVNDLASPLFALVMGMSAQLMWNASSQVGRTLLQQALRGLVLIALGVWITMWGSWVAVVLAYLGLLLLVGAPLLRLGSRWVAGIALAVALLSDPLNAIARTQLWILGTDPAVRLLADLTVLGTSHRLTNLLPFFLLGALLLRHGARRDRVLWGMAAIAPLAYLVRPVAERISGQTMTQSGTYGDTLHDVGLVFSAYVVVVLLATSDRAGPARVIGMVFAPLRVWGRLALSLYLLHAGIIAVWLHLRGFPAVVEPVGWLLTVVLPLALTLGWDRWVGVGPMEWAMGWITARPKPFRGARPGLLVEGQCCSVA